MCVVLFSKYICLQGAEGGQGERGGKQSNLEYTIVRYCLKCLITKKKKILGFPPSVQDFFFV